MKVGLEQAIKDWEFEVETEVERLILLGTPPYDAIGQARYIVNRRRAEKVSSGG